MKGKLRVIIYGTGSSCETILKRLSNIDVIAFSDSDYKKHNTLFHNKMIIEPIKIKEYMYDKIIVASVFYEEIVNYLIDLGIDKKNIVNYLQIVKEEIICCYNEKKDLDEKDFELGEVRSYLNKDENKLQVFCYKFYNEYINRDIEVFKDEMNGLYYVLLDQKKMYFKRTIDTKEKVKKYYNFICAEQDIRSPHRYLSEEYDVDSGSIVVDIGVAEGNFALSVIEKVRKVYLFEMDEEWVEALNETFKPYMDKVYIIKKFVSNMDFDNKITLDNYKFEDKIDFIKMDVEGEERFVLEGAQKYLTQDHLKLAVCVYHKVDDAHVIKKYLDNYFFDSEFSKGYMFFDLDDESYKYPYFRKGILRAKK